MPVIEAANENQSFICFPIQGPSVYRYFNVLKSASGAKVKRMEGHGEACLEGAFLPKYSVMKQDWYGLLCGELEDEIKPTMLCL